MEIAADAIYVKYITLFLSPSLQLIFSLSKVMVTELLMPSLE